MRRVAVGAAVSAVLCFVTVAVAQDIEISSLDTKYMGVESVREQSISPSTDRQNTGSASGKQVRLVGPRFFPDNSKDVELFGRARALLREEARSQFASQ